MTVDAEEGRKQARNLRKGVGALASVESGCKWMKVDAKVEVWLLRGLLPGKAGMIRHGKTEVCLSLSASQVEPSKASYASLPPPLRGSPGGWRTPPIGVAPSNEGGHRAPLLAPHESILGIHSLPHSSTPRSSLSFSLLPRLTSVGSPMRRLTPYARRGNLFNALHRQLSPFAGYF